MVENQPRFDAAKGKETQDITVNREYDIEGITDIRLKKGTIGFFISDNPRECYQEREDGLFYYKSTNNGTFISVKFIQPKPKKVSLPEFKSGPAGYHYGKLLFSY